MRVAIIQLSDIHDESAAAQAVKRAGMEPLEFSLNDWHEGAIFDAYVVIGEHTHDISPVMINFLRQENQLGKPILGIAQGAHLLVKTGLVPGLENDQVGITLAKNKYVDFSESIHIRLTDNYQYNAFTQGLNAQAIERFSAINHEGQFIIPRALLIEMTVQGLGLFRYCNAYGEISDTATVNPTGSVDNIAAVTNKAGNVMAIIPHIEQTPTGHAIFHSMREYIAKGHVERVVPLYYQPRS